MICSLCFSDDDVQLYDTDPLCRSCREDEMAYDGVSSTPVEDLSCTA